LLKKEKVLLNYNFIAFFKRKTRLEHFNFDKFTFEEQKIIFEEWQL